MNKVLLLFISIFFFASCGSIKPEPPEKRGVTKPIDPIPVIPSTIDIPIEIDLQPVVDLADSMIDPFIEGKDLPCQGLRYRYKVKRESFALSGKGGNELDFRMKFKYAVKGDYCAVCFANKCAVPTVGLSIGYNEPMKRGQVGIKTNISVQSNYRLKTNSKITEIKATDPIKEVFGMDVTQTIINKVKPYLNEGMTYLDEEIGKVNLKTYIQPFYDEMQRDIDLGLLGHLNLMPDELSLSRLTFEGRYLRFSIGVNATPTIKYTPWEIKQKPLPPLSRYKSIDGFNAYTDLKLDYDSLSKSITQSLVGEKFEAGKNFILIDRLNLFPIEDRIGIDVTFSGSKKGRLYFTAIPTFDTATQRIKMADLKYDLSTKNVLLKSAKWLLSETIREKMEESMNVDVTSYLNEAKAEMNRGLNEPINEYVRLSGKMEELKVTAFQMRPEELFMRLYLKGNLKVLLTKNNKGDQ
jgi:hypothetical protein